MKNIWASVREDSTMVKRIIVILLIVICSIVTLVYLSGCSFWDAATVPFIPCISCYNCYEDAEYAKNGFYCDNCHQLKYERPSYVPTDTRGELALCSACYQMYLDGKL